MKAKDIMTSKLVTVMPDTTVSEVVALLKEKSFHHLPVLENGKLVGIISDRDLLKSIGLGVRPNQRLLDRKSTKIDQIYTKKVATVDPDTEIKTVGLTMIDGGFHSVLVTVDGVLKGIITSKDLIQSLIKIEDHLLRTAKLSYLGTVTATMAHELRSPLNLALLETELLAAELDDPKLSRDLTKINHACEQMNEILDFMQDYVGRSSPKNWKPFSINESIRISFIYLEKQLASNEIEVKLDLTSDIPEIEGDKTQFEWLFQNLISNSKDAFIDRGDAKDKFISFKSGISDSNIIIKYEDNAGGMPEEVCYRIFEPFFTTKPGDKGTGLGMSIVQSAVTAHNGKITINSKLGQGTEFKILIPLSDKTSP